MMGTHSCFGSNNDDKSDVLHSAYVVILADT